MLAIQVVTLPTVLFRKGARHLPSLIAAMFVVCSGCPLDTRVVKVLDT